MDSSRIKQVNAIVKAGLALIIQSYIDDEIASITRVDTANDLAHSKIYVSVLRDDESVIKRLNDNSKDIRHELAGSIKLRIIPVLHFLLDTNEQYAEKIDNILNKL